MKKITLFAAAIFAAGLVLSTGALAAAEPVKEPSLSEKSERSPSNQQLGTEQQQQKSQQQDQMAASRSSEQKQIQALDEIQGFKVRNRQGESLGEVAELLIDIPQGKVGYAVVSSGGVLGMGEEQYIVPFAALKLDAQQNALTLDMDKEKLKQAPQGDIEQALNRETGREIHQFYGVSPYWEEAGAQPQPQEERQQQLEQEQAPQREQIPQRDRMQRDQPQQQQREKF